MRRTLFFVTAVEEYAECQEQEMIRMSKCYQEAMKAKEMIRMEKIIINKEQLKELLTFGSVDIMGYRIQTAIDAEYGYPKGMYELVSRLINTDIHHIA